MSAAMQLDTVLRSQRRAALRRHPTQTGLDYVETGEHDLSRATIFLHFVPAAGEVEKETIPREITAANIRIAGLLGGAVWLPVEPVVPQGDVLTVQLERREAAGSEPPSYSLTVIGLADVDPFFSEATFSLEVDRPRPFDCAAAAPPRVDSTPVPEIDYLAKDYASFRKLMLDRLSLLLPEWRERSPADGMVAAVEAVAAAADHLSYFQDAVATEAYLGTARQRTSVRRHARLLDYPMHEGCTARTWVTFQVKETSHAENGSPALLDRGAQLLTHIDGQELCIEPGSNEYMQALTARPEVFETVHSAELAAAHNELRIYPWGAREFWLPEGATSATLVDPIGRENAGAPLATRDAERSEDRPRELHVGYVLLFEEKRDPTTGRESDADPERRHAVRLVRVTRSSDPLGGRLQDPASDTEVPVLEVEWHAQDALPFPLCVSTVVDGKQLPDVSVARGNVVLVEHGRSVHEEELEPAIVPKEGCYRPRLRRGGLAFRVPYDHEIGQSTPAVQALFQDPRAAIGAVHLGGPASTFGDDESKAEAASSERAPRTVDEPRRQGALWSPRRDLLTSDRFAREFVVEMGGDGGAHLRFGDGARGRKPPPGARLRASYRIGNGTAGNVGRDAIAHLVAKVKVGDRITSARNPLPARGGVDPEPIEQVRLYAPHAFRAPERCVTEADYVAVTLRHPEVERVAARRQYQGSWQTMLVAVERRGGRPVDPPFKSEVRAFLERFRLAGSDVQVRGPRYVAAELSLTVHVQADSYRSVVKRELLESFSNAEFPDGRRGFFHRAGLGFGESVYLSRVLETATRVPGVAWVDTDPATTRFQRVGQPPRGELAKGHIDVGPLEIARLDNDSDAPENGTLELTLEGGR